MTNSEKIGLQGCPCMDCDDGVTCDPRAYCIAHTMWLEGRKKAMHHELEDVNRRSRQYIKNLKK